MNIFKWFKGKQPKRELTVEETVARAQRTVLHQLQAERGRVEKRMKDLHELVSAVDVLMNSVEVSKLPHLLGRISLKTEGDTVKVLIRNTTVSVTVTDYSYYRLVDDNHDESMEFYTLEDVVEYLFRTMIEQNSIRVLTGVQDALKETR